MCYTKKEKRGIIMFSTIMSFDSSLKPFFNQLTEMLGFGGYLAILLGVELLFAIIFGIRANLSYEARMRRTLDRANQWLFMNKVVTEKNIKAFNQLIKKGPKRFAYFWQQYILYNDGAPSKYMTVENLIEKPLKTSTRKSSIRSLAILTGVWSVVALIFGFATQKTGNLSLQQFAIALIFPLSVLIIGAIAIMIMKARQVSGLDQIYHLYHIFARFVDNACADLPKFIDFNLLFTKKEIENGNPQLREYYESMARKAKEEFEKAKLSEVQTSEFNFKELGIDGALLLDRAMKESSIYINKKTKAEAQIAQAQSQQEALRRNYETVQMDLQRKIQATKENITKYIEQQAATTSRFEVNRLRQEQDKEVKKQETLQRDYDQEEAKFRSAKAELDKEIEEYTVQLETILDEAEKAMSAEYQSFFEKVMKSAYAVAEKKTADEKKELKKKHDVTEQELINVQTQIKRLMDENLSLREKLDEATAQAETQQTETQQTETQQVESATGSYDSEGNYMYADGSYHSPDGLFHDVDGKIYDMNGVEVTAEVSENGVTEETLKNEQINQFGSFIPASEIFGDVMFSDEEPSSKVEPIIEDYEPETQPIVEDYKPAVQPIVEDYDPAEESQPVSTEKEDEEKPQETTQETTQEVAQEPESSETQEPVEESQPAKKRGRPRKVKEETVAEEPKRPRGRPRKTDVAEEKPEAPAKKRGRPRKDQSGIEKKETPAKRRGRPRKTEQVSEEKKAVSTEAKKRGRPKGSTKKQAVIKSDTVKKRGRPKKSPILNEDISSLSKISKLINDEEDKLRKMKMLLNSEIDEVLKAEEKEEVDKEKMDLIKAVEELKAKAENANQQASPNQEISDINKRLEALIKEISTMNNKK